MALDYDADNAKATSLEECIREQDGGEEWLKQQAYHYARLAGMKRESKAVEPDDLLAQATGLNPHQRLHDLARLDRQRLEQRIVDLERQVSRITQVLRRWAELTGEEKEG